MTSPGPSSPGTPADKGQSYGQHMLILGLVSGGHALSNFYILCLPPLIPLFKDEFGVSYTALGLMLTARSVATGVLQLPIGFMVDRFGGKGVLAFGLLAMSVSVGMIGLVPNFWWALAATALLGIGVATIRPSNYTILNASMPPTFIGRSFGINMFAGHTGRIFAPPLIVFAAALWGWRAAILIAGGIGLAVTAAILSQWRKVRDDAAPPRAEAGPGFVAEVKVLASYSVFLFFVFYMLQSLSTNGLHSFLVAALAELHGTPLTAASSALTAFLIAGALGVLAGGFIVDKTPRHELVAVVALVVSAALLAALGTVSLPVAVIIATMSLIGIFQGTVRPARDMLLRAVLPRQAFGKAISMVATGAAIGGAVAPVAFGWIMDIGEARWLFYLVALCLVLLAATLVMPKERVVLPPKGPEAR